MRRVGTTGVVASVFWLLSETSAGATPPLQLPWDCGSEQQVTNGHNTSSHTGMDAWAWDFGLLEGTVVRAPADGVVRLVKMDSNRGGCSSEFANDANYVVVQFEDGTEALHMHLAQGSSHLKPGDIVMAGDPVGTVGLTGWVCGPHLHFQIQETCGSWWCQSVPAAFVDVGDPGQGTTHDSENCSYETPCEATLGFDPLVVDDTEHGCFRRVSPWFWRREGGEADLHQFTWANDDSEPGTIGMWIATVSVGASYRFEAHLPASPDASQLATYELLEGDAVVGNASVDQSSVEGWVELFEVELDAGTDIAVRLADNTGEPRDKDRRVIFDAIRIEPIEPGGGSSTGEEEDDGGTSTTGTTGPDSTSTGEPTGDGTGGNGGGGLPAEGAVGGVSPGGCRVGGTAEFSGWWLGLLLVARRRWSSR